MSYGMTDGELVEQARSGDAAAFGELVDRHQAAVYRRRRGAFAADAEDGRRRWCWRFAESSSSAATRASARGWYRSPGASR
jgi:DNA-directed RNA polymerase specialized sigma24 family protein